MTEAAREAIVGETRRLILRHWRENDIEAYDKHCNTQLVMKHLGGKRKRQAVEKEVRDLIAQQRDYGFTLWVVENKEDGEVLGFCGLDQLDYLDEGDENADPLCTVKNELELGFRFRADRWGKGFATEASVAALNFAFERLRAKRVVARVAKENDASRNVLRALGMRHDFGLDYWARNEKHVLVYTLEWRDWLQRSVLVGRG